LSAWDEEAKEEEEEEESVRGKGYSKVGGELEVSWRASKGV
jgi:hypothetical protein